MKTIRQINEEIEQLEKRIRSQESGANRRHYNGLIEKLKRLRIIGMYLETNPSEKYLQETKQRFDKIIESKEEDFYFWKRDFAYSETDPEAQALFEEETGLDVIRRQLETINYILQP